MALRFDLNPPRELANTFLTALARSAQCTGFYEWILDALSRARALTISRACCSLAGAHAHLGPAHVSYTQNLKLVSLSFSPRQHAHCTPRTLASTHVCFERLTTEVQNHLYGTLSIKSEYHGDSVLNSPVMGTWPLAAG